ncbi:MAG: hypothetical protein IT429_06765 [Gemmataceae bacterium]|nr:hypothetical protein [Gemmataceae bacterium]
MSRDRWLVLSALALAAGAGIAAGALTAQEKTAPPKAVLTPEALERWGRAEAICAARLVKVDKGPVGLSEPPLYTHTLHLRVDRVLRGALKKGDQIVAAHSVRQRNEPTFPVGKDCLAALANTRGRWQVLAVREATAAEMRDAELASEVPLGWSFRGGRLVSPWVDLKPWPAEAKGKGSLVCAGTGRPALKAGAGVVLTAEPVPPKVEKKFQNPDGDGEYRIAVKNTTDRAVTVPALVTDGRGKILWKESLAILCQKKAYPLPGAQGGGAAPGAATLAPGQEVSTTVNVLRLQGPEWPRGGSRIEFQFCLGEKGVTRSFYYFSRHHDALRAKLLAGGQ